MQQNNKKKKKKNISKEVKGSMSRKFKEIMLEKKSKSNTNERKINKIQMMKDNLKLKDNLKSSSKNKQNK